jgi:elongation factor G
MKNIAPSDIRNVSLISHGGHGTTSLGEAILFNAGATTRLGSVDQGTSTFDIEAEEVDRRSSVSMGLASCKHRNKRITMVDTPGSADFVGDTDISLRVCDGAVVVISAVDGVEVRTETLWHRAHKLGVARVVFINKLDRERADFDRAMDEAQSELSSSITAVTIPIGKESSLEGIVDLLSNRALIYSQAGSGQFEAAEIPADMADRVETMRERLVEEIAGSDETLMDKYFEEGDLGPDDLRRGLATAIKDGLIFPAFAGSATKNIGVQPLMDLLSQSFPGADERPPAVSADGEDSREPSPDAPFSGFVFKTIADQFAGQLSVFRVMSGTLRSDGTFYNSSKREKERYGTILSVQGKGQKALEEATVGDIVAVAKLKNTRTGDTICDDSSPIEYPEVEPPRPVITYAVKALNKGDVDKIYGGLARLREEDISIRLGRSQGTGETLLSGMGQVHIEVVLKKLLRKFKVEATLELPIIPYKETIKSTVANETYRHKKQTGGKGQFGECTISLSPKARGEGFEFENGIVGGAIPRQFIPAVEKGVMERMDRGVLAGFRVVDITVRLFDGKFHPVDSSEMAFKIAGAMAFKSAFEKAKPILLEPVWELAVIAPKENVGDIMGDISGRRGKVLGMEDRGKYTEVKAQVPLREIQTYSNDLRSMTSGRGSFEMEFDHYQELSGDLTQQVITEYKEAEGDG